jgi:hypothetical protein
LTFYNKPVTRVGPDADSFNVLEKMKLAVRPQDFVVVKVDFDSPHLEVSLVEAIARSPQLAALVDEIFVEYHFNVSPSFGWHKMHMQMNRTVDDALQLMRRLREVGVRSHFWI